ncbi:uncharacterized protein LOC116131896 [Pistacia vera]|uniref:uncharacterized protein LOC116131896 n=1 Tax=Pistacia vera TaxID=55513 RepID=UPI001262FC1A|nr:uncharacterized protein LOC116131896 [Pistacia vera]
MEIRECDMLIEIVENDQDGAKDEITFNKLKWLSLEKLPSLTCFCTGKCTFKFQTLEELIVKDCPNMKTFCEGVLSTPRLQKVWEDKCLNIGSCSEGELNTILQQLHRSLVHSNFEILRISGKDITPTWPDQFSSHDFGRVKSLEFIKDESTNIPTEILQRFDNLEELTLKMSSYQEIFSCEKNDRHAGILSKIQILQVYRCCKLNTLVPSSATFKNLTTLEVWHCDGLRNLISFATAKSLKHLEIMTIKLCEMMTEIVANEADVKNDEIVFSKMRLLSIEDFKSFTCFCSGNYTFKFPSLRRIDVKGCPKMKTFSGGVLSTPCLEEVWYNMEYYVNKKEYEEENCGLNEIIQQLHKKSEFLEL